MVKTRGAHSKKTPTSHTKLVPESPAGSVPSSVSTVSSPVSAPDTSAGARHKAKPRKQTTQVPSATPLVFPDVDVVVPMPSPQSKVVVTE